MHCCIEAAEEACKTAFAETCSYACCCCDRRLFKHSVVEVTDSLYNTLCEPWATNVAGWVTRGGSGHICHTCLGSIRRDRCPRFSVDNGLGFPDIPDELQGIPELSERLIARRVPFLQLRRLPAGQQHGLRGRICFMPQCTFSVPQTSICFEPPHCYFGLCVHSKQPLQDIQGRTVASRELTLVAPNNDSPTYTDTHSIAISLWGDLAKTEWKVGQVLLVLNAATRVFRTGSAVNYSLTTRAITSIQTATEPMARFTDISSTNFAFQ
ncbi:hypothetical protein Agub_g15798, partial [Astrephomene gubernaculifera]